MRCTALAFLLLLPATLAVAEAEPFPRPAGLEDQVRFWTRIYSEVDTGGGLIHDSRLMGVVYEQFRLPPGSYRARRRAVKAARQKYVEILRLLGAGRRSGLSAEQQRVLALFPEGVSNETLRGASQRVRFQLGQADKFRAGVIRSGRWEPHIAEVLADHGVPYKLAALPHVESSYNPVARSHAGAAGLWQFTRSTGRLFMRVDYIVDERFDPYIASDSAARLLLANHRRTGNWPLAITAYNHGPAGMERAIRQLGTRDIVKVVERYQSRSFKFASRNFYAEFLAALEVSRNHERYFGELVRDPAEQLVAVETDHFYSIDTLARIFDVQRPLLLEHNRALQDSVWSGQKYVPKGFKLRLPLRPEIPEPSLLLVNVPASERILRQKPDRTYRVHRGDTLSKIAARFGVRESELVALNGLRSRHRIRIGQVLKLPTLEDEPTTVASVRDHSPNARRKLERPPDGRYRVHRGDTLTGIAETFGVRLADLVAANTLRSRNRIYVGQVLHIPGGDGAPALRADGRYVVRRGDTLARIARRLGVDERDLLAANTLRNPDRIQVGQVLKVPGEAPAAPEPAAAPAAPAPAEPPERAVAASAPPAAPASGAADAATPPAGATSAAPADDAVATALAEAGVPEAPDVPGPLPFSARRYQVAPDGSVVVHPEETLGHYADWLEIPTQRLRDLNGLRFGRPLAIGRRLRLDFSKVAPERFEQRRVGHHRTLQAAFFESYAVSGTESHVTRPGDTLWKLSRRAGTVPVWLIQHYNPGVDVNALQPGMRIRIPVLEPGA